MIVLFDWSVDNLDVKPLSNLSVVLKELLRAHRNGTHFVVLGRATSVWAMENLELDSHDRATLSQLYGEYTQTGNLVDLAAIHVRLESDPKKLGREGKAILVDVDTIYKSKMLDQACLVTENFRTDGEVYRLMIDRAAELCGITIAEIDLVHGGGDDVSYVFEAELSKGRASAVIVDSDMKSPFSAPTPKVDRVRQIQSNSIVPSISIVLPCHEVENLLPLQIFESFLAIKKKRVVRRLMNLNKIDAQGDDSFCRYHDICGGVSSEKLSSYPDVDRKWVEEKLKTMKQPVDNIYIEGIGKPLTKMVKDSRFRNELMFALAKSPEWVTELFVEIVWLFVARPRQAT